MMPFDPSPTPIKPEKDNENHYFIDLSTDTETSRLLAQARLITRGTGGILTEHSATDLAACHRVLDIACGPGSWALEVAARFPDKSVTGIDISRRMIEFAQSQAASRQLLNAEFLVMDATKPLRFADASFDLVNARLLAGFLPKSYWPTLLAECRRLLSPGGIVQVTDHEIMQTSSPAMQHYLRLVTRALWLADQTFSPDGLQLGMLARLGPLLREAGFLDVQHAAYGLDCSAGTSLYQDMAEDNTIAFKLVQPFLLKMGVSSQEELDRLYQQAMTQQQDAGYCALLLLATVWGRAPA
jgi:SAM-dependent methyltransferase